MNEIRQHRSAHCDDPDPKVATFTTLDELLKIPWVENYSKGCRFHRFSIADNCLMAEYRAGREWWVVGYLKHPAAGLPAWVPVRQADGQTVEA